jgi:transposase InsO family protein
VLCAAAHNAYIPTWEGWLYLATVIDCYTKACIGYAMANHLRAELVIDALNMAARNYPLADGAIFHSDYAEPCVKPRDRVLVCAGEVR